MNYSSTEDTDNVWYLLNDREKQLARQLDADYFRRYHRDPAKDPSPVYFLGDRYEFSRTWSAVSGSIPTYRKNCGRYLFRSPMRFLSHIDKLASLGWPMTGKCSAEMLTIPLPALDVHRAHLMAGNSMHLTVAGMVLLTALACFSKKY